MTRYGLKRLAQIPIVLAIMSILLFIVVRMLPGDPAFARLGTEGGVNDAYTELRAAMDLDAPIAEQYWVWVSGIVRLEFGESLITGEPVVDALSRRLLVSAELGLIAMALGVGLGVPLALASVLKPGRVLDGAARSIAIGGLSLPIFWTATLLLLVLSLRFAWIPPVQYRSPTQDLWVNLQQMVIAGAILSFPLMGQVARLLRLSMLEALEQPYVQAAIARGLARRRVLMVHALKNALIPVVTLVAASVSFLIGGVVVTESIFSIPGMGSLLLESLKNSDYPMLQGVLIVVALVVIFTNLLVDLSYAWMNPRVRYEGSSSG